jgi:hypothetical protein
MAFDPLELTKEASLNRTLLADLPGADPHLVGQRGWDVLRLEALASLAAEHGIHAAHRSAVPRRVSEALASADLAAVDHARRVVAEYGRRLGHLVATLRLGFEEGSPWRTAYRQHWRSVDRIWLGGGVTAALGSELLQCARTEAVRLGVDDSTLDVSPHADVLALLGAARSRAGAAERAIVLDFGYSSVKRGVASFRRDTLQRLDVLRSLPPPRPGLDVARSVLDVIRTTIIEAQPAGIDPEIVISLATYVHDRRPINSSELYDLLNDVDFEHLDAELTRLTGVPLRVRCMHDGTAAAAGVPSNGRDGVVVLGTSLGAGFTLPEQQRLPVAVDLQVRRASEPRGRARQRCAAYPGR